jgi:very-short-patch-repair endonuclease
VSAHGVDAAIAELARRQHGVVARRQLRDMGVGRQAIDHRLREARLHAVHRGVYAVGHTVLSRRGVWMAATLVTDDAVLSHRAAGALWGVRPDHGSLTDIVVTRAWKPRPRVQLHRMTLRDDEITRYDGIPVTTPARTLLDLAAIVPYHHLERAATEAEIRRLGSPTSLADLVARYPGRAGTPAVRRLLERRDIGRNITKRELELRFLAFLDAHRIPRPHVNARVDGREVDCLWPEQRLIAELDGFATHGTRTAFETDRARDRALLLAGYRVTRITWRQLAQEPKALAAELDGLLSPRGSR